MSLPIFQRTIVDSSGNIQPGASVAVRNETTGDLVTIYADREGGTAKANPFLADSEGFATFYVEPGEYQVTATTTAGAITWSHVAIGDTALLQLAQPAGDTLVGSDDGAGGTLWTTVAGALGWLKAEIASRFAALAASGGAALVGFIQPFANSVLRTLRGKGSETVSILDFIPESEHSAIRAGTSTFDCTASIQAAVTSLAAKPTGYYGETNGWSLYFPWGTYRITTPVVIPINAGVSFLGDGGTKSKIYQTVDGQDAIRLSGNNYRGRFKGVHITGNQGQVGGTAKAINISGSGNQIYVEDCWLTLFGYLIYGAPTSDSNFTNNVLEYSQTPISLTGAGSGFFHITGNQFYNCGPVSLGGTEQRPSFEFANTNNLLFANNRIVIDTAMSPQTGGVFSFSSVNDFVFSGNIFTGSNYDGRTLVAASCNRGKISDNVFKSAKDNIIRLTSCGDISISKNTMPANKAPTANALVTVRMDACSNTVIAGNVIGKSGSYGIALVASTGACVGTVISGNVFDGGTGLATYSPVYFTGASGLAITGNVFRNRDANTVDVIGDTTSGLVMNGNVLDGGYTLGVTVAPATVASNIGGFTRTYLNAAPTSGTWRVGDKIEFTAPTAGGNVGAVCVTAGTPGTWKTYGAIAA